jgi:hypothetical protein
MWFTLRTLLWFTRAVGSLVGAEVSSLVWAWSTRAVGSLVGAEVSSFIWASSIIDEGFLVGTGGFSGEVAGSSGIRGGSLGKAIWSSLGKAGSLGKAIWSSLVKALGSFLGKEKSVSIVKADSDGSSFDTADKDGISFDGGFGGILVLCSYSGLRF